MAVIASGGAGKTFFGLYTLAHLKGPKIVCAPRLARELVVPFISGQTNNQLQMMQKHDTFVASKVADADVSLRMSAA